MAKAVRQQRRGLLAAMALVAALLAMPAMASLPGGLTDRLPSRAPSRYGQTRQEAIDQASMSAASLPVNTKQLRQFHAEYCRQRSREF